MQKNKYDEALSYEILQAGEYSFLNHIIGEAKTIFDIGGHRGYFLEYCLSLNKNLVIHFFEPVGDLLKDAKGRIGYQNIIRNNFAIGDKSGVHNFFLNPEKSMQSSFFKQTFLNPVGVQKEVIAKRLDEYIDERTVETVDLVKMDIEGSEFDVVQSLPRKYLEKIKNLCIEYHIWDTQGKKGFDLMIDKLGEIYKHLDVMEGRYTSNVGYVFARQ